MGGKSKLRKEIFPEHLGVPRHGQPLKLRPVDGCLVPRPSGGYLAPEGEIVLFGHFWKRRLREGCVEIAAGGDS